MTPRKAVKAYSRGSDRWNWNGGRATHSLGYKTILIHDGRRSRHQFEHILIAERALGHALPKRTEVHHVNGDPGDNTAGNLVVCPDHAYHMLLHRRTRALEACGNPNAHRCRFCGGYDRQSEIRGTKRSDANGYKYYHLSCNRDARARFKARQR